jgi:beta-1,2-mannobiose phosphorylase / 1,2-beta-oligomannan phosphorylase
MTRQVFVRFGTRFRPAIAHFTFSPMAGVKPKPSQADDRHGCEERNDAGWQGQMMTRRELMILMTMVGFEGSISNGVAPLASESNSGWQKWGGNPVLGGQYGTCFDVCVLYETGIYKMWFSWRPPKSLALTESRDGIRWSSPEIVLGPNPVTGWENDVNRPVVVHREDDYHMWYTGQANGKSMIGYAKSSNGRKWERQSSNPVLESSVPWEGVAVMCPHVIWDEQKRMWRLWYSAGQQFEPNAIGYATSVDGLRWGKYPANPVLTSEPGIDWEKKG